MLEIFFLKFLAPPKEKHEIIRVSAAVPDENDDDDDDDGFEDLSVEELASLFLNFKTLDKDTSEQLLAYMKRLEKSDPAKLTEFKQHLQKVKSNKWCVCNKKVIILTLIFSLFLISQLQNFGQENRDY